MKCDKFSNLRDLNFAYFTNLNRVFHKFTKPTITTIKFNKFVKDKK